MGSVEVIHTFLGVSEVLSLKKVLTVGSNTEMRLWYTGVLDAMQQQQEYRNLNFIPFQWVKHCGKIEKIVSLGFINLDNLGD